MAGMGVQVIFLLTEILKQQKQWQQHHEKTTTTMPWRK